MKLIYIDKLTEEQRRELAVAAQVRRPDATYRKQFAKLTPRWRELRQNRPAEVGRRNGNA
jgi:hypothetical protein